MNSLLQYAIEKGRLWDFKGGIHPPEMKDQTSHIPIRRLPISPYFIIPLVQHTGREGRLLVAAGDHVLKGQPLTEGSDSALPVHAPTSGTIKAIAPYTVAHPSGLKETCVYLEADGKERWCERVCHANYHDIAPEALVDIIHQAGVAGLGGAGFPAGKKLKSALDKVETLIINAAECEPYITADDCLMQEYAAEIVTGIEILQHILSPTLTIIGIEDNKPEAIEALKAALPADSSVILRVIPTKYPSGGAKQLTKILTGLEVPHGARSSSIGVLMHNVGTTFAIKRAIVDGEPLIERVTTLTGDALPDLGNFWVPLGTPVGYLLQQMGLKRTVTEQLTIMGGPLMGFTILDGDMPIVKISNCILVPSKNEFSDTNDEQNCIRCGRCADACPVGLLPQQLYWFSRGEDHEKAKAYNLFDCIECGSCAYVCPSNIPLVQYYRQEKAKLREIEQDEKLAQLAKQRFEAKQARVEREKAARNSRHNKASNSMDRKHQEMIQAALERVKAKERTQPEEAAHGLVIKAINPDNSAVIAAREERKQEAREHKCRKRMSAAKPSLLLNPNKGLTLTAGKVSLVATDTPASAAPVAKLDRKASVAEAIARAKAKKAQVQAEESVDDAPAKPADDKVDRKAAVAEAIARAKAKKAQVQAEECVDDALAKPTDDKADRKAAVAEAIARAKARKAQVKTEERVDDAPAKPTGDKADRKAAVAEAIARAKARKAQVQAEESVDDAPAKPTNDKTDRKAAVAEAIARAKAKKAAIKGDATTPTDKVN